MRSYKKLDKQDVMLYDKPDEFIEKGFRENTIHCKCGHSVEFWSGETKELCTWCGNYVFKTPKDEFNYKMKGLLKK